MTQTSDLDDLLQIMQEKVNYIRYNKFSTMFPDEGDYRRELYAKQIMFLNATANYSQTAMLGANRTGKTTVGAYAMTCHLTGLYPHWWEGRKFVNPIKAWASGKTNAKTKDVIQVELLGEEGDWGSGMIPKHLLHKEPSKKQGAGSNYVERIEVKHVSGGVSILELKSYEQGRDGFEGTKQQLIWLDEEPRDASIYAECVMRTADKVAPGIIQCTFTPLYGLSDVAMKFVPDLMATRDGRVRTNPDRFALQVTWDDVPHLTAEDKARLWAECEPHQRDARSKGIPSMGSGAIYPFTDDQIVVDAFEIPPYWPKCYGLDTGWQNTAAVFLAQDPETNIVYAYNEYYGGQSHPAIHSYAIKQRGAWMTGAADAFAVNQSDGSKMIDLYKAEGLNLIKANKNDRDSGIFAVNQLMEAGMFKIFDTCQNLLRERRKYSRDERGKIIKKDDHTLDAMRYALTTAIEYIDTPPSNNQYGYEDTSGRDKHTGY